MVRKGRCVNYWTIGRGVQGMPNLMPNKSIENALGVRDQMFIILRVFALNNQDEYLTEQSYKSIYNILTNQNSLDRWKGDNCIKKERTHRRRFVRCTRNLL